MGDAGLAVAGGDGLEGSVTLGNDQIDDVEVGCDSNDGDSPSPSSLSIPAPQMATMSFSPIPPVLLDELLQLPLLENAPFELLELLDPG